MLRFSVMTWGLPGWKLQSVSTTCLTCMRRTWPVRSLPNSRIYLLCRPSVRTAPISASSCHTGSEWAHEILSTIHNVTCFVAICHGFCSSGNPVSDQSGHALQLCQVRGVATELVYQ